MFLFTSEGSYDKNGHWQCIDNKEIRQRELFGKLISVLEVLVYTFLQPLIKFLLNNEKNPLLKPIKLKHILIYHTFFEALR